MERVNSILFVILMTNLIYISYTKAEDLYLYNEGSRLRDASGRTIFQNASSDWSNPIWIEDDSYVRDKEKEKQKEFETWYQERRKKEQNQNSGDWIDGLFED